VYNLSGMSRVEAESLIQSKEGSLCVRFFQRADGTIITDDCPVGLRVVRRPLKWMTTTMAILVAPLFTFAAVMTGGKVNAAQMWASVQGTTLYQKVSNWLDPQAMLGGPAIAGGMSAPPPPPTAAPVMGKSAMPAPAVSSPMQENVTIKCEPQNQGT
jgi:hypothetical protein